MCGIAGILKIYQPGEPVPHHLRSIPEPWLDVLDESIKHRGPDGQGRFRDRALRPDGSTVDVAFVHRRLSIIDHDGGHQPMAHDGERLRPDLTYQTGEEPKLAHELCPDLPLIAVVFNGCIYNHSELRAELESQGHVFETDHSDTEVLVHGWREWRHDVSEAVYRSSMAACGTWDRLAGSLSLARDFFGQKTLYLGFRTDTSELDPDDTPRFLTFSSNPNGPRDIPMARSTVRADYASAWIAFGHYRGSTPDSTLAEIDPGMHYEIPHQEPGAHARSRLDRVIEAMSSLSPTRDRDPDRLLSDLRVRSFLPSSPKGLARRLAPEVDALVMQSVSERLQADVPVACLLSGGVDSSLVAAHAQHLTGGIRTVSVRMPDAALDESVFAQQVAGHLGTDHHVVDVDPRAAEDLVGLIERAGVPFGDSSLLPTFWACRAASAFGRVLLTGDGGDELFVGYQRHTAAAWIARGSALWMLFWLLPLGLIPARSPRDRSTKASRFIESARRMSYTTLTSVFGPRDLDRLIAKPAYRHPWRDAPEAAHHAAWMDLDFTLPSDYLRKVDIASMSVPVETRAPLLDRRLLQASIDLGPLNTAGGRKAVLRHAAKRHLPERIVDRPKQGFAIPIGQWFRTDFGGMRQLMLDHLRSADPFPGLGDAGVEINTAFVERMLKEHDAAGEESSNPWHGRDHSQRLYTLLVLSIWAKWLDRDRREQPAHENARAERGR